MDLLDLLDPRVILLSVVMVVRDQEAIQVLWDFLALQELHLIKALEVRWVLLELLGLREIREIREILEQMDLREIREILEQMEQLV